MIGRQEETHRLRRYATAKGAELLVITGRRRVGKTFLIRNHFADELTFDFVGTQDAERENQLGKWRIKLSEYSKKGPTFSLAKDWTEAFQHLKQYLLSLRKSKKKRVIFLDEFPWMDSHRSGFLREFTYWWNDWAAQQNLLVIICGSATSWMIKKVIENKGGLYNRVTATMHLQPFTLAETKAYLRSQKVHLDNYQILQLYMTLGGIPYYLRLVQPGESATQAINRLCFRRGGELRDEFENLYAALYEQHERHISVIRALYTKWKGLTRQEIIQHTKLSDGGGLTKILNELVASSFVMELPSYGKKKKDTLYRLVDQYSLFYLKYIEGQHAGKRDIWLQTSKKQSYQSWRGYAFENICIKHSPAIEKALGISGLSTQISSYLHHGNDDHSGLQIDMIIDRADNCINICEMKFYNSELTISADLAAKLRRRRARYMEISKTRKTIYNTIVTTYGILEHESKHMADVDHVVTMDALFELERF